MGNDVEASMNTKDRISEILAAFKYYDGVYKRKEIDAAIERKDEITPALIMILEDLLSNPHVYIDDGELYDHIYAVMLLGHFKKPSAHKLFIDIFSLPDDLPDKLFGDMCTADLPTLLFNTCNDSIDHMKNMALDTKVDDYCRVSACQAIAYAVVAGYATRKEVLDFFSTLFTSEEADQTSDFWGLVAIIMEDLCPEEYMDLIQKAFDDGLISPGLIGYEYFEQAIALGKEKCLEKLQRDLDNRSIDDLHASMSWWACFQNSKKASTMPLNASQQLKNQKTANKKKASAKKKKRKQANKSRKKNRR